MTEQNLRIITQTASYV